jgi:excisionase family DNA binding protein
MNERLNPGELYTVHEVAVFLRCSPSSVYRAIRTGDLGYFRLGSTGDYRVSGIHLQNFLEAGLRQDIDDYEQELAASGAYDSDDDA